MTILECETRSRVWVDGRVVDEGPDLGDLAAQAADPETLVWVDLIRPSTQDLAVVATELGLGVTAVEDALAPFERPKVTRHEGHLFFMTYATKLRETPGSMGDGEHGRLRLSRVSGFVLPHALITIRLDDAFDIDEVVRRWDDNADLLAYGPGALLHGLMDTIVDGQFETIQQLDDAIEALEDQLFEERPGRAFLRQVYGLRKDLVSLRRVVLPMREVVNAVLRHRSDDGSELARWYDDLYDHVLRAAEWTESLRDMVTTVFETNLSLQDMRLNVVMKQLAAWAAIIAVPTAITGWFGQNIPYPGYLNGGGLWLSVALITTMSASLFALFRRRGWL